ncbi:histidinol-phosphate aminotransferase [Psychromonas sp. CNPT3]|uniref:histidinol-phosphate transaminase n=1 Tax=Psychromonas sp. CNPT3 TaxID=314282 RepID=UPI00006E85D8|nr:histidinol-phosphate transaminase [Psychromonas sp. CNPT3]AGH81415.1 histidinol-phosphate aminotransferase [Psychromonas sp. CNPT3]
MKRINASNSSNSINDLARQNIQTLTPYLSARRIGGQGDIWLNANEAPDCSAYQLDTDALNRYPECQPQALIQAYAQYAQVQSAQVLCTRGADEGIELLVRAFCEPKQDSILICPPTYAMYAISAQTAGVGVVEVPLDAGFNVDYQAVSSAINNPSNNIKLVFLCAPNNPCANMLDKTQLIKLLRSAKNKALIVVDEAYIEFCNTHSHTDLIDEHENLVLLRTLSKAFALAAIRCGFSLSQQSVIRVLEKVIAPYPIASPVAQIAEQALSAKGLKIMRARVTTLNKNREILHSALQTLPCVAGVFDGTANFLLVRFNDSEKVFNAFSKAGIIMRDFSNKARLHNCIRISIGSISEITTCIALLKTL